VKIYETIISILDEKGPLSIPLICQEVNQQLVKEKDHTKPLLPSHIQSIVTRKKDLFRIKEGNISIAPDIYPYFLVFILHGDDGITYQVNINFSKKSFSFFEWRDKGHIDDRKREFYPRILGDLDEFKREVMALKIWKWKSFYGTGAGITIGKINWKLKLKTKTKTLVSEGTDSFPERWPEFCQSIEKLTGGLFTFVKFLH
jgi:hypothetical protein